MLGKHIGHCEDSLTAAVFTHLLHLPAELFWRILSGACYHDDLPKVAGEPVQIAPWPHWDSSGTKNSSFVEPDLFMRFLDFDLIVEAKRWDDGMQSHAQWMDQLIAYTNEYGEEKRNVKMIALGGIHGTQTEQVTHGWNAGAGNEGTHQFVCPVVMCRWRGLLQQCKQMREELHRLKYRASLTLAHVRILTDVIDLFGWHGYSTGQWFSDFDFARHRLANSTGTAHQLFQQRSQQLTHV